MDVKTIAVLGAGQMGAGIAQAAAASGFQVLLRDIKQEYCDNALAKIRAALEKRVAAGKAGPESVESVLKNIRTVVDLEDVAPADFVIEAAPEIMELKQSTFRGLGEICREDAILCTNTSSMPITEVTKVCRHPDRCAGMHFFFPVGAMKLVEVIRAESTSDATVTAVAQLARQINKVPVECRTDTAGFIVNRCLMAFLLEAIHCYDAGVATIEDIDTAIKLGLNHPMGPFQLMDMSGIDTLPHVLETLQSLPVTTWDVPESVKALIAQGRYGNKSGGGWYEK